MEESGEKSKKSAVSEREERILKFWQENKIFEKSLEKTAGGKPFVFYDGPPFATGLPHYGHILAGTIKDIVPRYETMRGRYVRRVWGWDCHGLPVENLIEKDLGLERKKDIEEYGIEKFNDAAKKSVLKYDKEWKEVVPRMGRWIDMENAYRTMDWKYSESIWWAFKTLFDKGLIYEGYKSMHICPRCETTLASSEVTLNYQNVKDISLTAKFELEDDPGTFLLAWTTTPWTLPGNVALAVGGDIEYVLVGVENEQTGAKENYILGKERIADVLKDKKFETLKEFKGSKLVGKKYKPLFDYYANDTNLKNRENGWKVYSAEFVTTEAGTGIVHIAPAFGEDDMNMGRLKDLPFVQHVGVDGRFKPEVKDFSGLQVKAKGDTQSADIEIIKYLAGKSTLFSKEKIEHSYPLCWRCDTPLINYAASSWFVKVTAMKEKLLSENATTKWVPENMRDGRFGHWLEGARDWAISRSRYWGAPIPVWRCEECKKMEVVGSLKELGAKAKTRNKIFVMRHGEAESNEGNVVSSRPENPTHLTEKGRKHVLATAQNLKDRKIDLVFVSDFLRTKETAEIVAEELEIPPEKIVFEKRLGEINTGDFDGRPITDYRSYFSSTEEKFTKRPPNGENLTDVKDRTEEFLKEVDGKYEGKTILLITHEYPAWMMSVTARGCEVGQACAEYSAREDFVNTGDFFELFYGVTPLNRDHEVDFHRPYIDEIKLRCECGGEMKRVPEVFDCWFESGSMPYAQFHYPFENEEEFKRNFPAEFIAEGLDQTRGWFYNMLVLAVGLFEKSPFKNVVVSGIVLAEDGQKMSKKLKNYPDPMEVAEKYGADAIRYYLLSSPLTHAEDLNFLEKGVDDVYKKIIMRLGNVVSFYEMYKAETGDKKQEVSKESENVLDKWIMARLSETLDQFESGMEACELDRAVKPLAVFVDDLSTWYLRRSRERIKAKEIGGEGDAEDALGTLEYVLHEFSKIIAPAMPFIAEDIYKRARGMLESVHLENWPTHLPGDISLLQKMAEVRRLASFALELRSKEGIKVRQPLSELRVKNETLKGAEDFLEVLKDEVNVKNISFDPALSAEAELDTEITAALKEEGQVREFIRNIQELRKKWDMSPKDTGTLLVSTTEEGRSFLLKYSEEIKRKTLFSEIEFQAENKGDSVAFDEYSWTVDKR